MFCDLRCNELYALSFAFEHKNNITYSADLMIV